MVHVFTTGFQRANSVKFRQWCCCKGRNYFPDKDCVCSSTVAVCMVQKLLTFVSNVVYMSQYLVIYST